MKFELPLARELWRQTRRNGIIVSGLGTAAFVVGALLVLTTSPHPWEFRIQIALVLLGAAAVVGTLYWNPLFVSTADRIAPTRLVVDGDGIRLELFNGEVVRADWNDQSFELDLYDWPAARAQARRWTMGLGPYSTVPLDHDCYNALQRALEARHLTPQKLDYRTPFGRGVAHREIYRRPR